VGSAEVEAADPNTLSKPAEEEDEEEAAEASDD